MKFTLNQNEIEQALRNYVGTLFTINEGAEMSIDIKNTRGADGVTAEIDVALVGSVVVQPAVVEQKAQVVKAEKPAKTQTTAGAVAGAATNAGKPETKPETDEQAEQAEQQAAQQEASAEAEAQQETQEEVQAEVKPRTSLFGGLKKPTN